ncbi:conjugal transfer pilin signal peptidase TrbI [Grimontella sp. AG753]|nr:conjugal transfer pilin signal peptidase TrbI [Grimontella sp. AG753]
MPVKFIFGRRPMPQDLRSYLNTVTVALCLVFAYSLFKHILIPATHSVYPLVLYRTGEIATEQGQYVMFQHKDAYLPRGEAYLVKRLGCISGQYLTREGNQFFCDGKDIAHAMNRDSKGQELTQFQFTGVIPQGKAFAVGDTSNSYDSRYWGFIDLTATERLKPIF